MYLLFSMSRIRFVNVLMHLIGTTLKKENKHYDSTDVLDTRNLLKKSTVQFLKLLF